MKNNKFIISLGLFAALFFTANIAWSSENHHSIVYIDVPRETNHQSTTNNYQISSKGLALSDAFAQIDCTFISHKWHGGIGVGFNEEYVAPAAGICKRWGETQIKGTFGVEHGKKRGGVGVMFQFE